MADSYNNEFPTGGPLLKPEKVTRIAHNVNELIRRYDAMQRFREMVALWVRDHMRRSDERAEFEKRRDKHEERIRESPELRDEAARPPGDGWRYEFFPQRPDENGTEGNFGVSGWVPPELSSENGPEAPLPLPVPDCNVSIQEKHAALAAIHDIYTKGVEKIHRYQDTPDGFREYVVFHSLMTAVRAYSKNQLLDRDDKLPSGPCILPESDEQILYAWLDEVRRDLDAQKPPAHKTPSASRDLGNRQTGANDTAVASDPEAQGEPAGKDSIPKYQWLAGAMLFVKEHPEWSDRKIASEVGKHHSTLSRSPQYQLAAALARGQKTYLPAGEKNGDTGDIEAWDGA